MHSYYYTIYVNTYHYENQLILKYTYEADCGFFHLCIRTHPNVQIHDFVHLRADIKRGKYVFLIYVLYAYILQS